MPTSISKLMALPLLMAPLIMAAATPSSADVFATSLDSCQECWVNTATHASSPACGEKNGTFIDASKCLCADGNQQLFATCDSPCSQELSISSLCSEVEKAYGADNTNNVAIIINDAEDPSGASTTCPDNSYYEVCCFWGGPCRFSNIPA
ncbi:Hypothetical predicted protein [Lecanosticta acicola]|uniref:Extracellular membrane protein CFEM domain-containing protein n=1 Tax=Lecanosticta acicola TaxID=111012 RepID=A0AAI8W236_9PEZI|nr:Hypothetical predicted protein [Lecanosticta acicola]